MILPASQEKSNLMYAKGVGTEAGTGVVAGRRFSDGFARGKEPAGLPGGRQHHLGRQVLAFKAVRPASPGLRRVIGDEEVSALHAVRFERFVHTMHGSRAGDEIETNQP